MNRHSAIASAAVFATALAFAPTASAATTRYVSQNGPNAADCSAGTPCDFAKVLTLTGAGDTIVVKQGTYTSPTGLTVTAPNVSIVGEGGGAKPKVTFTGPLFVGQGLSFATSASGGQVRGLSLDSTSGLPVVTAPVSVPITVSDVEASSSGGCVSVGSGSSVVDSKLVQTAGGVFLGGACLATGEASTIRNVDVTSSALGGPAMPAVTIGGGSTVDRLTTSGSSGVIVGSPAGQPTTIRRSRLTTTSAAPAFPAPALGAAGPLLVTDSVVRSDITGAAFPGFSATAIASGANLKLRNVTALASGSGAVALVAGANTAPSAVSIRNSVLRGDSAGTSDLTAMPGTPALFPPGDPVCTTVPSICLPTQTPDVTIDHSNFRGATGTLNPASGNNQTADPQFADAAAGNFRAAPGSPLIDAGVDDPDNGPFDFEGTVRKQGAAVDIGAFEVPVAEPSDTTQPQEQQQQPTTPNGGGEAPVITPPAPDRISPALSALGITNKKFAVGSASTPVVARAKKGTTFVYTLSEPARTAITIERADTGRRKGKSCVKATSKNRKAKKCTLYVKVGALERTGTPGTNAVPFSGRIGKKALKPATYRASLLAVDAAGNKSTAKTIGFTVVKK